MGGLKCGRRTNGGAIEYGCAFERSRVGVLSAIRSGSICSVDQSAIVGLDRSPNIQHRHAVGPDREPVRARARPHDASQTWAVNLATGHEGVDAKSLCDRADHLARRLQGRIVREQVLELIWELKHTHLVLCYRWVPRRPPTSALLPRLRHEPTELWHHLRALARRTLRLRLLALGDRHGELERLLALLAEVL